MSAVPFVLVAICIGVPLALVGWHVYEQWQIGRVDGQRERRIWRRAAGVLSLRLHFSISHSMNPSVIDQQATTCNFLVGIARQIRSPECLAGTTGLPSFHPLAHCKRGVLWTAFSRVNFRAASAHGKASVAEVGSEQRTQGMRALRAGRPTHRSKTRAATEGELIESRRRNPKAVSLSQPQTEGSCHLGNLSNHEEPQSISLSVNRSWLVSIAPSNFVNDSQLSPVTGCNAQVT